MSSARKGGFFSRFFGLIILPAQLPGEPLEVVLDLKDDFIGSLKRWDWKLVRDIAGQIFHARKISIPDDPELERLRKHRDKFLIPARGWHLRSFRTHDGCQLDGCEKPPGNQGIPPRYIIFVGGNSQKYEYWLQYFELYASDSGLGFICFNFRGVGRSEGAVTCLNDMLLDLRAVYEYLTEEKGVLEHHILFHGFSIGAAISAAFLAQDGAPRCAITSDRSFRSFCHAAFAICRGFDAAVGREVRVAPPPLALQHIGLWCRWFAGGPLLSCLRFLLAHFAIMCFRCTGWELNASEAWPNIQGKKVLLYNTEDNIVSYEAASLHFALAHDGRDREHADGSGDESSESELVPPSQRRAARLSDTNVIEVTIRDASPWALHDCPLNFDEEAWYSMIRAEREALGLGVSGA